MKNRLAMVWLALLTVFVSFTINDNYIVLRKVESGQQYMLLYMEKSAAILSKIKRSSLVREETPDSHPMTVSK